VIVSGRSDYIMSLQMYFRVCVKSLTVLLSLEAFCCGLSEPVSARASWRLSWKSTSLFWKMLSVPPVLRDDRRLFWEEEGVASMAWAPLLFSCLLIVSVLGSGRPLPSWATTVYYLHVS